MRSGFKGHLLDAASQSDAREVYDFNRSRWKPIEMKFAISVRGDLVQDRWVVYRCSGSGAERDC